MTEIDALDPVPEQLKLTSGTVVALESLRARQFFKFLRIITHGALPVIQDFSIFNFEEDANATEFGGRLLSLMVLSIPDAEDETIGFVRSMCKPVGLIERRNLNKVDAERNNTLWAQLDAELENPDLDDLVTIIEAIVRRESEDIQALGKRLAAMFKLAQRTGQVPAPASPPSPDPISPAPTSSAGSPAASTFSPASTAGVTTGSVTFTSGGSVNVSPRSESDASTPSGSENDG